MEGMDEDKVGDDLKQIILPKNCPDLTDFIECVMSQVIVCRATVKDMAKKARHVQVGHPGLVCHYRWNLPSWCCLSESLLLVRCEVGSPYKHLGY
jgi:hypothetical protein